jgi:hypothetical protein
MKSSDSKYFQKSFRSHSEVRNAPTNLMTAVEAKVSICLQKLNLSPVVDLVAVVLV